MLILPDAGPDIALERAKVLHERVGHIHLRYGGITLAQITISIGLAIYPLHGKNMHSLITASDFALYKAKKSGRNKTILYELNLK